MGAFPASAVSGDSRACIHLPVQFGDKNKGEAGFKRFYESRTLPYFRKAVVAVPDALGSYANFFRAHAGVGHIELGATMTGNQPVARDRNAVDPFRVAVGILLPPIEIYRSRERCHRHKLSEGEVRLLGKVGRRFKGILAVGG